MKGKGEKQKKFCVLFFAFLFLYFFSVCYVCCLGFLWLWLTGIMTRKFRQRENLIEWKKNEISIVLWILIYKFHDFLFTVLLCCFFFLSQWYTYPSFHLQKKQKKMRTDPIKSRKKCLIK